jgi:hypothetical protein
MSNAEPRDKRPRDPEQWIHRPMDKYRKGKDRYAFRPDAAFFELADAVVQPGRTLLGYDRLYVFWQAVQNVANMSGAVAEVGTYRGGSAYFMASAFRAVTGAEVPLHVFDTFEGHPAAAITDRDPFHRAGQFSGTSYDDVRGYLGVFPSITIHRGDVIEVLPGISENAYRLVHIDTDLYLPTKVCLEYFAPRLPSGGVVVLDDYAAGKCGGVRDAVVEFFASSDVFQAWDMRTEQLMLVRR